MIICDFVLLENFCNLGCKYCRPGWNKLKYRDGRFYWHNKTESIPWKSSAQLQEEWIQIAANVIQEINPPIIKLSGGEIFIIPDVIEIIKTIAREAEMVQILTNGTILNDKLTAPLKSIENLHYQISIDGHLLEMNSMRFRSPFMLKKVLSFLDFAAQFPGTVEINCVISKYNIDGFFSFAEYISKNYHKTIIVPFPVRGCPDYSPTQEQVINFEKNCLKHKSSSLNSLPPEAYMARLIEIMRERKRINKCYVPLFILSAYGDGTIQYCTCGGNYSVGNIVQNSIATIRENITNTYKNPDTLPQVHSYCCDCYTHYDIINLFLEDEIQAEDLEGFSIFTNNTVRTRLNDLKTEIMKGSAWV